MRWIGTMRAPSLALAAILALEMAPAAMPAAAQTAPGTSGCSVGSWTLNRSQRNPTNTMRVASGTRCTRSLPNMRRTAIAAQPAHGELTLTADSYTYRSTPGYRGTDSFAISLSTNGGVDGTYSVNVIVE